MKIISHRGYWKNETEKNSEKAFMHSFDLGFGTETDIRDCAGKLLISHDMPNGNEIDFSQLIKIAAHHGTAQNKLLLALNIKADGLAKPIKEIVSLYPELECFAFDMTVPDMLNYIKAGIPVYTRMSEVEQSPILLKESQGIWLDNFRQEIWYTREDVGTLLNSSKVCVVSAELHKNDPIDQWELLHEFHQHPNLMLCTDTPESAADFFHGGKQ